MMLHLFHCTTDTSNLTDSGKLKLSEAVRNLERGFAGLLCFTHHDLKQSDVADSDIRIFLSQISVSQRKIIPLFEQKMADIISHVTLEEIIIFCTRIGLWNFLNFQLLQEIANYFGIMKLQTRIQEYSTEVNVFKRNTKLVDLLCTWAGRNTLNKLPKSVPVFVKQKAIKWKDYTLEDVARHEHYLTSEFQITQLVMRFSNAGEGSVLLMWLVAKSVANEMKEIMSGGEKPALDSMTIEELNICGTTFKVLCHQ